MGIMTKIGDISMFTDAALNFADSYKKRRANRFGTLEKQLIATSVFLGLLFIIFCVLFLVTHHYYNKILQNRVCKSNECIESAMTLLQTVDFSRDPCNDFYEFACGNFAVDHPLNENDLHNSWFSEKENQLNRIILDVLKTPITSSDLKYVRQTKEFYQSCINKSELNEIGLQPLYDILEILELPKFVPSNETVENFNLGRTLALAQRYLSQDIFVTISLIKSPVNNSSAPGKNSNIFKLSPSVGSLGIFDIWKPHLHNLIKNTSKNIHSKGKEKMPSRTQSKKNSKKSTINFISGILQKLSNDLDEENRTTKYSSNYFSATALKIISFASKIQKDAGDNDDLMEKNNTERTTFTELDLEMNGQSSNSSVFNKIDWEEYISILLQNSNKTYDLDNELIIIENMKYFRSLSKTLKESSAETIQRYVWWEIVEQYAKYTTSDIRAIYFKYFQALYGESSFLSRTQVCTNLMKSMMGVALSYEMSSIKNFTDTESKVLEMLKDIQTAFEDMVNSTSWMDAQTKVVILDKAKAIKNEIGFAKWMTNSTEIEEYYRGLELKKSQFLFNIMRISQWEVQKVLETLGEIEKNSSDVTGWFINPLQVNAYYSHVENAIIIPAGILRTPFYFRGLESLNYGAIGTVLGHELTHGFDVEGKNYNKFGEQEESLWPEIVILEYEKRARCFVNQYGNFSLYDSKKLNGNITLAENIADNGGIRESFKAYQMYVGRHGKEPSLPGFENFTHEQLLFLSYANIWCETATSNYYTMSQDSHSPQKIRVLGTLQNMKEFSEAFNCSKESFMNPPNKCILW